MEVDQDVNPFSGLFNAEIQNLLFEIIQENDIVDPKMELVPSSEKGFTSTLSRLKIISRVDPKKKLNLIVKMSPMDLEMTRQLPIDDLYDREMTMYTEILPAFNSLQERVTEKMRFNTVKCYKVANETRTKTLILEDATEEGFKIYDKSEPLDSNHFRMILVNLARFHALSFAMKFCNPEVIEYFADMLTDHYSHSIYLNYIKDVYKLTCSIVNKPVEASKLRNMTTDILEFYFQMRSPSTVPDYNVVCHSDCWINNFMFKYKDGVPVEMKIIDWQASIFASPVTDIAHFFSSSTNSRIRRDNFPQILDVYYEALEYQLELLKCKIDQCYPKSVFMQHVYKIFPYGLITGIIALPFQIIELPPGKKKDNIMKELLNNVNERCKDEMRSLVSDFIQFRLI